MKQRIENILLVLLSVTAALLLYRTLDGGMGIFGFSRPTESEQQETLSPVPVQPVSAVIRDGEQTIQLTEPHLLTPYFEQLRPILIELFGSAGEPADVSASEWQAALDGRGILLDYGAVLPVDVLTGDTGGTLAQRTADCLLIDLSGEAARLYVCDSAAGCAESQTALKTADLSALLSAADGQAVRYAGTFEAADGMLTPQSAVPLDMSLCAGLTRMTLSGADGIYDRDRQTLILAAFGFDVYTARSYIDSQGCRVYLSENGALRFGADGLLSFAAGEAGGIPVNGAETAAGYAAYASELLQNALAGLSGQPRYVLSAVETTETGTQIEFDALAGGYPMVAENGARTAASFVFRNGSLVQAEVMGFTVAITEGEASSGEFLPDMKLSTLLSSMQGRVQHGRLSPAFVQTGDEWRLTWCVLPVKRHEMVPETAANHLNSAQRNHKQEGADQ